MKTEKEKMLADELYCSSDAELLKDRQKAKLLTYEFNNVSPLENEKKINILIQLLGQIGNNVQIEANFRCDYGYNIKIGNHVFINYDCLY